MLIKCTSSGRARPRSSGFTLVELMVVVAIVAITATLAAPNFAQMLANYRVRSAAEGILTALNFARAEAVRRNSPVSFSLSAGSSGWTVSQVSSTATLQTHSNNEPATSVTSGTAATAVTFLPTGLVQAGTQLGQVTVSSPVDGSQTRRINVFGGGLIRMCDPGITGGNDPRRC